MPLLPLRLIVRFLGHEELYLNNVHSFNQQLLTLTYLDIVEGLTSPATTI